MPGLAEALLVASLSVGSLQAAVPDTMDTVRQLYASADYEAALGTLERIVTANASAEVTEIERYRALCLMALGRQADAETVIEHLVRINPSYQPDEQEPPRVRAAFAAVRARVLPEVARTTYGEARSAYDHRNYRVAVTGFERTLSVLDSLESSDVGLRDLRTVAAGFLELSRAAIPPEPVVPAPLTVSATPPVASQPAPTAAPPSDPIAIDQVLPPWNPAWFGAQYQSEFRGAVEVAIDDTGAVTSARIVEPVHPAYDVQLLEAATRWRYTPALRNGKPVGSTKRVDVVLRPRD